MADLVKWSRLSGVLVPCLIRSGEAYVSVRIVEKKLLTSYPDVSSVNGEPWPRLASQYITVSEADLLNALCRTHCHYKLIDEPLTTKDIIVRLTEFESFLAAVEGYFGTLHTPDVTTDLYEKPVSPQISGGWIKLNSSMIPYIWRHQTKFVPLGMVRYSTGLLTHADISGFELMPAECEYLRTICAEAGFSFTFTVQRTRLVALPLVYQLSKHPVSLKTIPSVAEGEQVVEEHQPKVKLMHEEERRVHDSRLLPLPAPRISNVTMPSSSSKPLNNQAERHDTVQFTYPTSPANYVHYTEPQNQPVSHAPPESTIQPHAAEQLSPCQRQSYDKTQLKNSYSGQVQHDIQSPHRHHQPSTTPQKNVNSDNVSHRAAEMRVSQIISQISAESKSKAAEGQPTQPVPTDRSPVISSESSMRNQRSDAIRGGEPQGITQSPVTIIRKKAHRNANVAAPFISPNTLTSEAPVVVDHKVSSYLHNDYPPVPFTTAPIISPNTLTSEAPVYVDHKMSPVPENYPQVPFTTAPFIPSNTLTSETPINHKVSSAPQNHTQIPFTTAPFIPSNTLTSETPINHKVSSAPQNHPQIPFTTAPFIPPTIYQPEAPVYVDHKVSTVPQNYPQVPFTMCDTTAVYPVNPTIMASRQPPVSPETPPLRQLLIQQNRQMKQYPYPTAGHRKHGRPPSYLNNKHPEFTHISNEQVSDLR